MARRTITRQLRVQILVRDEFKCRMCGRQAAEVPLEIDHVRPIAAGGTDTLDNLGTLCRNCNRGKSDLIIPDYTGLPLVPDGLEQSFKLMLDPVSDDWRRWHLYCYFKTENYAGIPTNSFHHEWKINGTRLAASSNRDALIQRRIEEETAAFAQMIRKQLAEEGNRLVFTEEGLVRIGQGEHPS